MAKQEQEHTSEDFSRLAASIQALVPKPELREGDPEYVERQRKEGWFDDFFGKTVYQNAYEAQARGLSEDIRRKTSELKSGKYLNGRVTVEVNADVIVIKYPVSGDNMMKNMALWSSFSDLITKIYADMAVPV